MTININLASFYSRKLLFVLVFAVLILVVLEIWAANRLATYGDQVYKLETAKESLRVQNEVLAEQIAEASSLQKVEVLAESLGYQKISSNELAFLHPFNIALSK